MTASFPRTRTLRAVLDDNPRYKGSIHDDAVARAKGFRAALVPGAFVYGYVSRLAADAFGAEFAAHGAISVRFRRPVFNGDLLEVAAGEMVTDGAFTRAEANVINEEGTVVAKGFLAMPIGEPPTPPPVEALPIRERPEEVPAVAAGALEVGTRTTTRPFVLTAEMVARSLADFGEDSPLYQREGLVHTGCLMRLAMDDTNKSFRLPGPIVLVEAGAQHFGPVRPGARIRTSGVVVEAYERNGRHTFVSEEHLFADEAVAARFRRTTIYA